MARLLDNLELVARGDFARLNFATSGAILDQILGRMKEAVKRR